MNLDDIGYAFLLLLAAFLVVLLALAAFVVTAIAIWKGVWFVPGVIFGGLIGWAVGKQS